MNLTFKDTSNIHSRAKKRPMASIPFSVPSTLSESLPLKLNNIYEERPIKTNSTNLSFKGLSSYKPVIFDGVNAAIEKFGEEFGETSKIALIEKIKNAHNMKDSGLSHTGDKITFTEKSFGKRFVETVLYPIAKMPIDIANSALKGFKKIPGFKKAKFLDNLLNLNALKNRRAFLENTSDVAGIQHFLEISKDGKTAFNKAHKRFNPLVSNYDATAERTLTRIVTGAIPAFFLANDAYNLSVYMNDNKDLAKKEKKRRFNQEIARIGITAGASFAVLSLFSKSSNGSAAATNLLLSGVTFVSEIIGRAAVGTPILPVSEKSAKKYAKIQGKDKSENNQPAGKDPKFSSAEINNTGKNQKAAVYTEPPKKGGLTFKNIIKIVGYLALAGFGVEKVSNIKSVKKILTKLNNKYKGLYTKDFKVNKSEFDAITKRLEQQGFKPIADKYVEMVEKVKKDGNLTLKQLEKVNEKIEKMVDERLPKDKKMNKNELEKAKKDIKDNIDRNSVLKELNITPNSGEVLNLGSVKNKVSHLIIHQLLTFPIRFAWSTLMVPYKVIVKPLIHLLYTLTKDPGVEIVKSASKKDNPVELLRNSVQFFKKLDKKIGKDNDELYKERVKNSIFSSLDTVTKSNYSNADLSSMVKNTASAVTSGFLIADNYNLVMIDSNGKDKELAEQKAKERTIQRGVRMAYGAFLLKLLNDIFANQYNGSLLGAQAVNVAYALATESLERTSVGLPLTESTREQIAAKEKANLSARGFKGSYFRMMAKLTGKKPLSEKGKDVKNK